MIRERRASCAGMGVIHALTRRARTNLTTAIALARRTSSWRGLRAEVQRTQLRRSTCLSNSRVTSQNSRSSPDFSPPEESTGEGGWSKSQRFPCSRANWRLFGPQGLELYLKRRSEALGVERVCGRLRYRGLKEAAPGDYGTWTWIGRF